MKALLKTIAWLVVIVLVIPQLFVFSYFLHLLVRGGSRLEMMQSLALLGLSVSCVSAPFFGAMTLLYKAMLAWQVRGYVILPVCALAGFLWVVAWNHVIFDLFTYGKAILPVLLCSLVSAGYALAWESYRKGLVPPAESGSEQ